MVAQHRRQDVLGQFEMAVGRRLGGGVDARSRNCVALMDSHGNVRLFFPLSFVFSIAFLGQQKVPMVACFSIISVFHFVFPF